MDKVSKPIYVYLKKNDAIDKVKPLIIEASYYEDNPYFLFTDVDRDYMAYKEMKKALSVEPGILILTGIHSIGKNKADIYRELLWYKEMALEIIIADFPSTHIFHNKSGNAIALDVIIDIYKSLLDNKTFDIRSKEQLNGGRKKINFPENWSELYDQWEDGLITAKEFMDLSNLKKGTFYHLVNEYRELLKINKNMFRTG